MTELERAYRDGFLIASRDIKRLLEEAERFDPQLSTISIVTDWLLVVEETCKR